MLMPYIIFNIRLHRCSFCSSVRPPASRRIASRRIAPSSCPRVNAVTNPLLHFSHSLRRTRRLYRALPRAYLARDIAAACSRAPDKSDPPNLTCDACTEPAIRRARASRNLAETNRRERCGRSRGSSVDRGIMASPRNAPNVTSHRSDTFNWTRANSLSDLRPLTTNDDDDVDASRYGVVAPAMIAPNL